MHGSASRYASFDLTDRAAVPASALGRLIRGMLPMVSLYIFYTLVRYAVRDRGPAYGLKNAYEVLRIESFLGLDWERTIQSVALPHRWLVIGANWYYTIGFLPVILLVAGIAAIRAHTIFLWWRRRFTVTLLMALICFASFPLAPPRMLPNMVDTLQTYGPRYYGDDHGASLFNAYGRLPPMVNVYAAMPSMHVAWSIIVGALLIAAFQRAWWAQMLGIAHPVLMAIAVIATANHFLLDVVIGVGTLGLTMVLLAYWERRHHPTTRSVP